MLDFQGTARPGTCRRQHFCSHPFYIVFVLDTNRFAKLVWSQTFHATYHDVNVQSARRIANTRDSFNANNPWICSYQESAEQTRRSVCCILRINKCWFAITASRHVILPQHPASIRILWWHIKKSNPWRMAGKQFLYCPGIQFFDKFYWGRTFRHRSLSPAFLCRHSVLSPFLSH
jgi:hypothetical protein